MDPSRFEERADGSCGLWYQGRYQAALIADLFGLKGIVTAEIQIGEGELKHTRLVVVLAASAASDQRNRMKEIAHELGIH